MKKQRLGHPQFVRMYERYEAIFEHYNRGLCTLQEMYEAIELLEKFRLKNLY